MASKIPLAKRTKKLQSFFTREELRQKAYQAAAEATREAINRTQRLLREKMQWEHRCNPLRKIRRRIDLG